MFVGAWAWSAPVTGVFHLVTQRVLQRRWLFLSSGVVMHADGR